MQDLHILPKLRDSLSYLYVEHAILEQSDAVIEAISDEGHMMIPIAALCVLLLGPGTSITHAAIKSLAENGCTVVWVGEDATRFYAQGTGETRKGYHLILQAKRASDPEMHKEVVLKMYQYRFEQKLSPELTLPQLRGMEGVRVKNAYKQASRFYDVPWSGRFYDRSNWASGDPINRALSSANALLNGLCHAAIVSGGYSPGLGFMHVGKQLSFVYDIADLYKVEFTIPAAFETVANSSTLIEKRVRKTLRENFRQAKLLDRILPDIDQLLSVPENTGGDYPGDDDPALPELLWEEEPGRINNHVSYDP